MNDPAGRPCRECPFRRESLPGYLGADNPRHFVALAMSDEQMPCHLTVDYESDDWREQAEQEGTQCSGRAIFLANQFKLTRNREVGRLPRDVVSVFQWPHEFLAHHEGGISGLGEHAALGRAGRSTPAGAKGWASSVRGGRICVALIDVVRLRTRVILHGSVETAPAHCRA